MKDLEPTMERILDFIEIKPTEAFEEEVRQQAERQRSYTSRHEHSPDNSASTPSASEPTSASSTTRSALGRGRRIARSADRKTRNPSFERLGQWE